MINTIEKNGASFIFTCEYIFPEGSYKTPTKKVRSRQKALAYLAFDRGHLLINAKDWAFTWSAN